MKTFYALLIAALFTTAACKKKDEAAKTEPAADPAAKPAEPAMADPATPDPAKADPAAAEPAAGAMSVDDAGKMANEFADKLVKAAADAGDDCAKLGANLKGLTEDAKKAAAAEKDFDKSPENKKAFKEKFEPDLNKKVEAPMKKIEKCMTNADVKGFIDTLSAE